MGPARSKAIRRLAVAASARYPDLREDWPLLRQALGDLGITANTAVWSDPDVAWEEYDLVVAIGAWDNIHRPEEYLAWVDRCAAQVRIVNSPATLRWNLDKRYLGELSDHGVATVRTRWLTKGDPFTRSDLAGEIVVKPTISGGGFQSARYRADEYPAALSHIEALRQRGRDVMVQPYVASVDRLGEVDLIFLGGEFSHAIAKSPLLHHDVGPKDGLFELAKIAPITPTGEQRSVRGAPWQSPKSASVRRRMPASTWSPSTTVHPRCSNSSCSTPPCTSRPLQLAPSPSPSTWPSCAEDQAVGSAGASAGASGAAVRTSSVAESSLGAAASPASAPPDVTSTAKSAQAACASVSGVNSPSA